MIIRCWIAFLAAAALACGPANPATEHEAIAEALARGDQTTALERIRDYAAAQPDSPESLLEHAALLVEAGASPEASWLLEAGIRRFPERDELRVALGRVALLGANAELARSAVEPVEAGSEHHVAALLIQAEAELGLGDLDRAMEILSQAETLYPDRPEARLFRVATLARERRFDEAMRAIERAKQELADVLEPERARALEIYAAQIEVGQENHEAAIDRLRKLVSEHPEDVRAWGPLIELLSRAGRNEEALELLGAAIREQPEQAQLYALTAPLYLRLDRPDEAEQALKQLETRSETAGASLQLARFYSEQGKLDASLAALRESLTRSQQDPLVHRFLVETLIEAGRESEARAELERLRRQHPESPQVDYLHARIALHEGDAATAVARLERIVPQLDEAATQYWLGRALEAQGDMEGARRRYGLATSREASWPPPYYAMIGLERSRGNFNAVASHAHRLVRVSPRQPEAWMLLGEALTALEEGERAEELARGFMQLFPDRVEPYLLLARSLRIQGQIDAAMLELDAAEKKFGTQAAITSERAYQLGFAGRVDEAIQVVETALASEPESALLHSTRAALLFQTGRGDAGSVAVDRALELEPADLMPLRRRCEYRASRGQFATARSDCERFSNQHPDDPRVQFILGAVLAELGEIDAAAAAYRRAAKLDEQAFAPRNNLAELLAQSGDLDGALAAAQEAWALAEGNPYVMDTVGWLYLRKGLVERSISILEDAHRAAPELPDAQLHLALAYQQAGREQDAKPLLSDLERRSETDAPLRKQIDEAIRTLR